MSADEGDPKVSGGDSTSAEEDSPSSAHNDYKAEDGLRAVPAGRVGRAHGLDGSFYVTGARPRLLAAGMKLTLDGRTATIIRRAGTDKHPIVRLDGVKDRGVAEALRGRELSVELAEAPKLEEGEWWAQELVGCEVIDGERHVGTVTGLLELPSCEALQVQLVAAETDGLGKPAGSSARQLLVPMVSDAIREVDPKRRRINVDMAFLGED